MHHEYDFISFLSKMKRRGINKKEVKIKIFFFIFQLIFMFSAKKYADIRL